MGRITAETDQGVTAEAAAVQTMTGEAAGRVTGRRRGVAARVSAVMATCAMTGFFGVTGAQASAPDPASSDLASQEYLEMLEGLLQELQGLEGFEQLEDFSEGLEGMEDDEDAGAVGDEPDAPLGAGELESIALGESELPSGWGYLEEPSVIFESGMAGTFYKDFFFEGVDADPVCQGAMDELDQLEEDADSAVSYQAEDGEAVLRTILVSTPEQHDMFGGYYEDIAEECGTLTFAGGQIDFHPTEYAEGLEVRMEVYGEESWFYMAGQSYGTNHVLVTAESEEQVDDFEEILADQLEKMEGEVG